MAAQRAPNAHTAPPATRQRHIPNIDHTTHPNIAPTRHTTTFEWCGGERRRATRVSPVRVWRGAHTRGHSRGDRALALYSALSCSARV